MALATVHAHARWVCFRFTNLAATFKFYLIVGPEIEQCIKSLKTQKLVRSRSAMKYSRWPTLVIAFKQALAQWPSKFKRFPSSFLLVGLAGEQSDGPHD